jgi:hypothetical protein
MRPFVFVILLALTGIGCQKKSVEPDGCQMTATLDNNAATYQYDLAGRLIHVSRHTTTNDLDYSYSYQNNQVTIELTYPGITHLRYRYDLTLNQQGYVLTAKQTTFLTVRSGEVQESLAASAACTYDPDGHLVTYSYEYYSYDLNKVRSLTGRTDVQLSYQEGNPVTTSYTGQGFSGVMTNRYGTQVNPVKLPFWLENNPFSFSPEFALQPFLGKPARRLITTSELKGSSNLSLNYTYQVDASGNFTSARRVGNGLVAPFSWGIINRCP